MADSLNTGSCDLMSFRNRLTSFFVVIVLAPMLAVGVLVITVISASSNAKAQSRASGLMAAAVSEYQHDVLQARADAEAVAKETARLPARVISRRLPAVSRIAGLERVSVRRGGRVIAAVGSSSAVAPATAQAVYGQSSTFATVSLTPASSFTAGLAGPAAGFVLRQGSRTLASTPSELRTAALPRSMGSLTLRGVGYEVVSTRVPAFSGPPLRLYAVSRLDATGSTASRDRIIAIALLVAFMLLALSFAVLASRGLSNQVGRFLRAARRLAGGDFSAPVPVEGHDEFAMLAVEFNKMSGELAERLQELNAERIRLRESIRRGGQTLASNLDPRALLELSLKTSLDGVQGTFGRVSARDEEGPLSEVAREDKLEGREEAILEAERTALRTGVLAEASVGDVHVAAAPLGAGSGTARPRGVLTVGRCGQPFSADDRDLLRSLVGQATLALENVELHQEVQRQAVTDELTGLANHGRFQEVLAGEMEQVRRYHYPVGLIMLDLDNFKRINDTYGHPQGDLVLKAVARVLKETSREADSPARYGGEEMALILPHTDFDGSHAIAERIRSAVEQLEVPLLSGEGALRVTTSVGVAAAEDGSPDSLIADADVALYRAKREGKNRVIRASRAPVPVVGGE